MHEPLAYVAYYNTVLQRDGIYTYQTTTWYLTVDYCIVQYMYTRIQYVDIDHCILENNMLA